MPTLAVTCEDRPALLVNLDFISENCRNDSEVKAALCHEFLHVLLRHTETIGPITPARHLALDAVINAIIHRSFGPDWSSLMSHYYQGVSDLRKLLRPMNADEKAMWDKCRFGKGKDSQPSWVHAWASLYEGRLVADDIAELAESFSSATGGVRNRSGAPPVPLIVGERASHGTPAETLEVHRVILITGKAADLRLGNWAGSGPDEAPGWLIGIPAGLRDRPRIAPPAQ